MIVVLPEAVELADAWIEGVETARWRSGSGHAGGASGSSVLEVAVGCRLPRHTDSAEETIVVLAGTAEVRAGDERRRVPSGGLAVIAADAPHEVRNVGAEPLRFVAVYASNDVVTRYEAIVQPGGTRERRPVDG